MTVTLFIASADFYANNDVIAILEFLKDFVADDKSIILATKAYIYSNLPRHSNKTLLSLLRALPQCKKNMRVSLAKTT